MYDFSVVIPTCNRDILLKRAITSALGQHSVQLEIIVVDDGQKDRADKNELLKYLEIHNIVYLETGGYKGGGYSRNLGVRHAHCDLIAFLDDDDEWRYDKLLIQKKLMQNSSIGMSYTGVRICDEHGITKRTFFHPPGNDDHFRAIMRKNFIGTTSSVVIRTDILREMDGFDPLLPALQDYDLYIRILKNHELAWTPEPLTLYNDCNRQDKVSSGRNRFIVASRILREKYRDEYCYKDLIWSIRKIFLLKLVRSRLFRSESLHAFFSVVHSVFLKTPGLRK